MNDKPFVPESEKKVIIFFTVIREARGEMEPKCKWARTFFGRFLGWGRGSNPRGSAGLKWN